MSRQHSSRISYSIIAVKPPPCNFFYLAECDRQVILYPFREADFTAEHALHTFVQDCQYSHDYLLLTEVHEHPLCSVEFGTADT